MNSIFILISSIRKHNFIIIHLLFLEINFQHTSIHDIMNLLEVKLQNTEIKFQVSSRTMKQKRGNILGTATFNMSSFEVTKYLSYSHAFPIMSEDFSLGTLKVTLQLGCGRMYFGKEFVGTILRCFMCSIIN